MRPAIVYPSPDLEPPETRVKSGELSAKHPADRITEETRGGKGSGAPTQQRQRRRGKPTRRRRGVGGGGGRGSQRKRPSSPWSSLLAAVAEGRKEKVREEKARRGLRLASLRFGVLGVGFEDTANNGLFSWWAPTPWATFGH